MQLDPTWSEDTHRNDTESESQNRLVDAGMHLRLRTPGADSDGHFGYRSSSPDIMEILDAKRGWAQTQAASHTHRHTGYMFAGMNDATTCRHLAVVSDYRGLIEALRARAEELEVSRRTLDEIGGLSDGQAAAILANFAGMGPVSLGLILGALGLQLAVIEDPEATARLRRRIDNGLRRIGKMVRPSHSIQARKTTIRYSFLTDPVSQRVKGKRRMALLTKAQRSAFGRRGNTVRWSRIRAERAAKK
jgi:hypothetical protein